MTFLAQLLVSGLAVGSIYALVALGFSLTFATNRTVNFSQGHSVMLGAVLFYSLRVTAGLPPLIAFSLLLLLGAVYGFAIFAIAIRPFSHRRAGKGAAGWLLSTIAVGIATETAVLLTFGREARALDSPFGDKPIVVAGIGILPHEFWLIIVGIGLALAVHVLLNHTLPGMAFRAISQSETGARLLGINTFMTITLAYVLSTILAFVAGVLIAPLLYVSGSMGTVIGVKGFAIAALAGMVWPRAIVGTGMAYGIAESFVSGYLAGGLRELVTFCCLLLLLSLFPRGLFTARTREV